MNLENKIELDNKDFIKDIQNKNENEFSNGIIKIKNNLECKYCNKICYNLPGLSQHVFRIHKISAKKYYDSYVRKENEGVCKMCGKETKYISSTIGYRKFCSIKCLTNSPECKEKIKNTCLKKYGVNSTNKLRSVREKAKKTMIKRYGVEHYSRSSKYNKQYKNTCTKKYGVDHPSKTDEFKETVEKTNLKKYGTKCSLQNKNVNQKTKQFYLKNYGVDHYSKTDEWKNKVTETCMDKYGIPFYTNSKKSKETKLKKYGDENFSNLEKGKKTNLKKYGCENPYSSSIIKNKIKQICLEKYGVDHYQKTKECKEKIKNTCLKKYGVPTALLLPMKRKRTSKFQIDVFNEIKNKYNNVELEIWNKNTNLSFDIFIPSLNMCIETHGDYWHCNPLKYKENFYHTRVHKTAKEIWEKDRLREESIKTAGYNLMIIWESDWRVKENRKTIIDSI